MSFPAPAIELFDHAVLVAYVSLESGVRQLVLQAQGCHVPANLVFDDNIHAATIALPESPATLQQLTPRARLVHAILQPQVAALYRPGDILLIRIDLDAAAGPELHCAAFKAPRLPLAVSPATQLALA